jgi:hypothetical protein
LEKVLQAFIRFTHKLPRKCRKEVIDATARLEAARLGETNTGIREEVTWLPTEVLSAPPKFEPAPRKKKTSALPSGAAKELPPRRP